MARPDQGDRVVERGFPLEVTVERHLFLGPEAVLSGVIFTGPYILAVKG